jgi:hypothetical protein
MASKPFCANNALAVWIMASSRACSIWVLKDTLGNDLEGMSEF